MRISDWSSDVCSSDLCAARARVAALGLDLPHPAPHRDWLAASEPALLAELDRALTLGRARPALNLLSALLPMWDRSGRFAGHADEVEAALALAAASCPDHPTPSGVMADRQSVGEGRRGAESVGTGGRR